MHLSKTSCGRWGTILFAVFVLALLWWFRPQDEAGDGSGQADPSTRIKRDHVDPEQSNDRKSGRGAISAKAPGSFTVDELVAIDESEGAAAALAAAKGMTGPERESQVVFILTYLARIDPQFVADELKEAGLDTMHQGFIVDAVMADWKDGKKALEWATSGFTDDLLRKAVGGALRILVRTDPDAALAYLETLPASGSRRQAMSDIFVTWGECDPKAAMMLLSGNFPTDEWGSAIDGVVAGWSRTHPAEAAAWVDAVQDETLRAVLVGEVVRNWRSKSPAEATAWVESLPDGPGKEAGRAALQEAVMVIECGFGGKLPAIRNPSDRGSTCFPSRSSAKG